MPGEGGPAGSGGFCIDGPQMAGVALACERARRGRASDPLLAALMLTAPTDVEGRIVGHDRQALTPADLERIAVVLCRPDLPPPPIAARPEQPASVVAPTKVRRARRARKGGANG